MTSSFKTNTKISNIKYILLGGSVFLLMYPSFIWGIININTYIAFFMMICSLSLEVLHKKALIISPPLPFFILFFFSIYLNINGEPIGTSIFDTRIIVSLTLFFFSRKTLYFSYLIFIYLFGTLLTLSLLYYILYITGIYIPVFIKTVGIDGRDYYNYPFNTMLSYMKHTGPFPLSFYRFSSFIGEPGWIGTRAALILISLNFDFKRFKILYTFLLAALFSFSLGAYIPLILSLGYFILRGQIKLNLKKLSLISLIIAIIASFNLGLFQRYIFGRLTIEDGKIVGDNRTAVVFESYWESLNSSTEIFLGKGKGQAGLIAEGAGWKTLVYDSGVFGMFVYLSIFFAIFFTLWKDGDRKFAIFFFFIFLITIYHRTRLHQIFYLLILCGGLLHNEKQKTIK